jgi:hypothetical protein
MKITLSLGEFRDEVYKFEDRREQFSYKGLEALYNYITELEDETGEEIEFDFVALCCDFTEYTDLEELQKNYNDIETMEDLESNTVVIPIENSESFIIQDF